VRRDPGRRRARFFDSYVTGLVTRDVQQISDIERPAGMRRLLSVVAARMGTPAVAQSMAKDVALPRQTLSRYLDLLELIFVIKRIPAWSPNLTTRAISTPKLIVTDSGLGGRFRAGIVLYAGEQQFSFGDRLTALPMAALWTLDR
jgi:uncharacterized protein